MLINLLPDFLAILDSADRVSAYRDYFERHRALLSAYWDNYVVEPEGPHFDDVIKSTVIANRDDLRDLLSRVESSRSRSRPSARCAHCWSRTHPVTWCSWLEWARPTPVSS